MLTRPHESPAAAAQRRAESFRVLRSQRGDPTVAGPLHQPQERPGSSRVPTGPLGSASSYDPYRSVLFRDPATPIAFLNLDLVILRANQQFQNLLSPGNSMRGRTLADFTDDRDGESLRRIRLQMGEEKDTREPAFLPPIYGLSEQDAVQSISESDVDRITQAYTDRHEMWIFRLPDGRTRALPVRFRLAKTTIFFVTMVVQPYEAPTHAPALRPFEPWPVSTSEAPTPPSTASSFTFTAHPFMQRPPYTVSAPSSPYYSYPPTKPPVVTAPMAGASHGLPPPARYEQEYLPSFQTLPGPATPAPLPMQTPQLVPPPRPAAVDPYHPWSSARDLPHTNASEGSLQLPPILGGPPTSLEAAERGAVRRRESAAEGSGEETPTLGATKRRRLDINEILEGRKD
ncbi:hypothetical protein LTR04_006144 [Oleoguttula sp. CCFEE 6159]|nr:hypothetical protein LTR04_006144 [Oleoguttula sp. CCFEE 6159]